MRFQTKEDLKLVAVALGEPMARLWSMPAITPEASAILISMA